MTGPITREALDLLYTIEIKDKEGDLMDIHIDKLWENCSGIFCQLQIETPKIKD